MVWGLVDFHLIIHMFNLGLFVTCGNLLQNRSFGEIIAIQGDLAKIILMLGNVQGVLMIITESLVWYGDSLIFI